MRGNKLQVKPTDQLQGRIECEEGGQASGRGGADFLLPRHGSLSPHSKPNPPHTSTTAWGGWRIGGRRESQWGLEAQPEDIPPFEDVKMGTPAHGVSHTTRGTLCTPDTLCRREPIGEIRLKSIRSSISLSVCVLSLHRFCTFQL